MEIQTEKPHAKGWIAYYQNIIVCEHFFEKEYNKEDAIDKVRNYLNFSSDVYKQDFEKYHA